jgi:hypothetical protein
MSSKITMPAESYPLAWPAGKPVTRSPVRSPFGRNHTVSSGIDEIRRNLKLMGGRNVVVTSNLPMRNDGQPSGSASVREGASRGVAVYWTVDNNPHVIACDTYWHVEHNLRAISLSLEAMRGIERWGAVQAAQMFQGFQALPPGSGEVSSTQRPWREVFAADGGPIPTDLPPEDQLAIAKGRYRRAIAKAHPDAGGDMAAAAELNQAMADAEAELTAAAS